MLARHHRLCSSQDFSRVYQVGRRAVSPHLIVRVLAHAAPMTANKSAFKVGVVVSQKVSKRSVKRNQIKRRLRSAIAALMANLPPDLWIVITARPGADQCKYDEFLRELKQLFIQLEVIYGHS
ncbi:MAG: ribonuclease P protein component [Nodosilinea sp.]